MRTDILRAWGGLAVKEGYIQRSGRTPEFKDPHQFLMWLERQKIPVERKNY
ncbi:hypothetical protein ASZ90_014600 [hydrocarbon metagenome]|uniref:Uncharacterized protein n=1 Tax=hydrocarbon metagenome TaxID=938273 RepID=A0A0W8F4F2_9ZZZZ